MFRTTDLIESAILKSCIYNQLIEEEEYRLPKEFVVEVDDKFNGIRLLTIIEENTSLNNKKYDLSLGDYILFKKDDIRVLNIFDELRLYHQHFSLRKEFIKIEKVVKNFFKNVFTPSLGLGICPFATARIASVLPTHKQIPGVYYDGDRLNINEKVNIFNNWVKVGYDAYEIYETRLGEKIVKIGKSIYSVDIDLFGNKYLQKV